MGLIDCSVWTAAAKAEIYEELRDALQQRCIVLAGAGASAAAGIPCFRHGKDAAFKRSGRENFRFNALRTKKSRRKHIDELRLLWANSQQPKAPKPELIRFLGRVSEPRQGQGGCRLQRFYTQNIDQHACQEKWLNVVGGGVDRFPKTVYLHGRVDKLICSECSFEIPFDPAFFDNDEATAACPGCLENPPTTRSGRAASIPGYLRTRVLLYDDVKDFDGETIAAIIAFDRDPRRGVGTVLVMGTSLSPDVKAARDLVKTFGDPQLKFSMIWVNPMPPPDDLAPIFGTVVLATCEQFIEVWENIVYPGSTRALHPESSLPVEYMPEPDSDQADIAPASSASGSGPCSSGPTTASQPSRDYSRKKWLTKSCIHCQVPFLTRRLKEHQKACVKGSCDSKEFCTLPTWVYHQAMCDKEHGKHPKYEPYGCLECGKAFDSYRYKQHVRSDHPGQVVSRASARMDWRKGFRKAAA